MSKIKNKCPECNEELIVKNTNSEAGFIIRYSVCNNCDRNFKITTSIEEYKNPYVINIYLKASEWLRKIDITDDVDPDIIVDQLLNHLRSSYSVSYDRARSVAIKAFSEWEAETNNIFDIFDIERSTKHCIYISTQHKILPLTITKATKLIEDNE